MQIHRLGNTDLELTVIGLGTWAIGGGGWAYAWGPQDEKDSIATICRALELGINWIDTAPVYGLGTAEEVVGKAIKEAGQRPIIATKCGIVWDDRGNIRPRLKKDSIRAEVEASLRRLQVDVIDLYQIHWPNPDGDIEEAWRTLVDLKKEGKIRYAGVSNFSVEQLQRIQKIHPVASLQPPYSMLDRQIEKEILPYCGQQNIGVIVYSPLQKGLLTGKFNHARVQNLPPDDHRRNDPMFQEPKFSAILKLVEKLKTIASRSNHTVAQLAIAWTRRRPEVTAAIVGARRPAQIEEIALAGDWQLTGQEVQEIDELLTEYEKELA